MLSSVGSIRQFSEQPITLVQGFGRSTMRPSKSSRSATDSSSETQGVQQPQKTQTRIFTMTVDEVQANPDTMIGIMFVFGTLARVLFYFRFNRSFVSTAFALHVDW